ncbi:MAG: hypothetical protein ABDH61_03070 [Acidilobaceae archaeon]
MLAETKERIDAMGMSPLHETPRRNPWAAAPLFREIAKNLFNFAFLSTYMYVHSITEDSASTQQEKDDRCSGGASLHGEAEGLA